MVTRLIPFTLTLEAPAVLTGVGGDPNSAQSLDFIPGSVIRGAIARALGDPDGDPGRWDAFHDLILSGRVRYLNAYPVQDGHRTLPAPVSWKREKYADEFHDIAGYAESSDQPDLEILEPLDAAFVTLEAAECREVRPRMVATIHHQRVRELGRAVRDRGAIFFYESLDAGQSFRGFVVLDGEGEEDIENTVKAIRKAAGSHFFLGRSRRAGYGGRARIDWHDTLSNREVTGAPDLLSSDVEQGELFRMLLISDYVGRNQRTGQLDPTRLQDELLEGLQRDHAEVVYTGWDFRLVGTFNRTWGLETPQAVVLQAGSVLVLKANAKIPLSDLLELESKGLGERRSEGFGRIVFLRPPGRQPQLYPPKEEAPPAPPGREKVSRTVEAMEQRLLENALRRRVAEVASERLDRQHLRYLPTPSLLGRLRTPLRQGPTGLETLQVWLTERDRGLRRRALEALERCRIVDFDGRHDISLLDWLETVLMMSTEKLGEALNVTRLAQRHHLVDEEGAKRQLLTDEWMRQVRWQLVDNLLALLAVEARRKKA